MSFSVNNWRRLCSLGHVDFQITWGSSLFRLARGKEIMEVYAQEVYNGLYLEEVVYLTSAYFPLARTQSWGHINCKKYQKRQCLPRQKRGAWILICHSSYLWSVSIDHLSPEWRALGIGLLLLWHQVKLEIKIYAVSIKWYERECTISLHASLYDIQ